MDKKICLDTDLCIEIIKGNPLVESFIEDFWEFAVFISSVTVFELFLRETDIGQVKNFVDCFNVLDFDEFCAVKASDIFKELKKRGKLVDFRDIFIAASSINYGCELATFNLKHFENIKELKLVNPAKN
ncbi:MAG: type II toxin-antitoxin system VapC family toxin [Candidatus Diapherotrites archaeon]|nr:type II toxin-antitoxin system VapC family toxin [Candidatus Diapherotrites archaeon]